MQLTWEHLIVVDENIMINYLIYKSELNNGGILKLAFVKESPVEFLDYISLYYGRFDFYKCAMCVLDCFVME